MNKFKQMPIKKQLTYAFSVIIALIMVMSVSQLILQSKATKLEANVSNSNEISDAIQNMKYALRLDQQMVMEYLAASSTEEAKFPQENHLKAKIEFEKNSKTIDSIAQSLEWGSDFDREKSTISNTIHESVSFYAEKLAPLMKVVEENTFARLAMEARGNKSAELQALIVKNFPKYNSIG